MCSACSGDYENPEEMEEVEAVPTQTACEWMRSNPTIPTERPEVMDEDKFRAKFNLAPRRL